MTPEAIYIIKLFIGFCAVFFGGYYIIKKIVESYRAEIAKLTPEEQERMIQQNKDNQEEHVFDDMTTNPAYSYLLYNTFHQTHQD